MNVFDLQAALTLDTSKYDSSLADSESKASSWGSNLKKAGAVVAGGIAVAGAAVVAGVNDVSKYGDEVDKMSQKLGMSTDSYQKWDYALNLAGTDMKSTAAGMKTLTNKLASAQGGSDSATEAFGKLGLSVEDLGNMSQEELFEATVKGLAGMEEGTERAALANELLGKSGMNLAPLLNMTAEEIDAALNAAEDYGMVMGEDAVKASAAYQDALTTLKGTVGGVKNSLLSELLPAFTAGIQGAADFVSGARQAFEDQGLQGAISFIGDSIYNGISGAFSNLMSFLEGKFPALSGFFQSVRDLWEKMKTNIDGILQGLKGLIEAVVNKIKDIWDKWGTSIKALAEGAWNGIKNIIETAIKVIQGIIQVVTGLISGDWSKVWEGIKSVASAIWDGIKNTVSNVINTVKTIISNVLDNIKTAVREKFEAVRSAIKSKIDAAKEAVSSAINGIKDKIKSGLDTARNTVTNIFDNIRDRIKSKIEAAKTAVKSAIDKIKGFFNFSWSLPKLKLPHLTITGSFNLMPPSVPSFSIEWYKKAYNTAYLFDKPTVGVGLGFGDGVGGEMVVGEAYLQKKIGDAMEERVGNLALKMEQIYEYMQEFFPLFAEMDISIDGDKLVGATYRRMDEMLGRYQARKARR